LTRKIIKWSLLVVTVLLLVSGLGISYFRVVETVTFGLLSKPLSFKLHNFVWIPFVVLLLLHVFINQITKLIRRFKKQDK